MKNKIFISIAGFLIVMASWFVSHSKTQNLKGGIFSRVATSSTISVGIQQNKTLFTNKNSCSSRIISTTAQPIMLSFHSDIVPTSMIGHYQAASTSVAYDGDVYGCGVVSAFGSVASTTITISEFSL